MSTAPPSPGTICLKDLSLTVRSGAMPCGFWQPTDVDWGTKAVGHTIGDLITWAALPEGAYELVFVDHVYLYSGGYWIPNVPPPGGINVLNYADNGVWALTGLPTQPVSFVSDLLGSDDYRNNYQASMPTFHQQTPSLGNSIAVECVATVTDGFPQFAVHQSQTLIQDMPSSLSAVTFPASLGLSRFRLSYGGANTGALAFTANAITVQTALNSLAPIIADGGVVCGGSLATGMTITWNLNGNRAQITSSILTVSPAYYAAVVTTQDGTPVLPEVQTITVAPWSTVLVSFPAQPGFPGGMPNRDLWDFVVNHHWFNVLVSAYSENPPPWQMQDIGLVDAWASMVCGPEAPGSAPTAVIGGPGLVEAGPHTYVVVFVKGGFLPPLTFPESGPSLSVTVNPAVPSIINLSNIPIGPAGTTDRYIYRTVLGDSVPRYVGNLGNNVTTVFADNQPDATVSIFWPVQPSSHFWEVVFEAVVDPFGGGPPYGFDAPVWRGYKTIGGSPGGRYYPWPPRVWFGASTYHPNVNDGIPYYDLSAVY